MRIRGLLLERLVILIIGTMAAIFLLSAEVSGQTGRTPNGLSKERWDHLVSHMESGAYSRDDLGSSIRILELASAEDLPVDAIVSRLEEAIAKRVQPDSIQKSLERRLNSLRTARTLLLQSGYDRTATMGEQQLVVSVASAWESGVPVVTLQTVLNGSDGKSSCHIQKVLEAGEILKLIGMDDFYITRLMSDFQDKRLCCGEILRVVKLVTEKHRDGIGPSAILQNLWVADASSSGLKTCPALRD